MEERKVTIFDYYDMCNYYMNECPQSCPMYGCRPESVNSCWDFLMQQPNKCNELILKWRDENPEYRSIWEHEKFSLFKPKE